MEARVYGIHLLPPEIILKIMLAYLGNPYDLTLSFPKTKKLQPPLLGNIIAPILLEWSLN